MERPSSLSPVDYVGKNNLASDPSACPGGIDRRLWERSPPTHSRRRLVWGVSMPSRYSPTTHA
jgi:hypothetical protein